MLLRKALGIAEVNVFPSAENNKRCAEKGKGIGVRHVYQGRKHHCIIPVVNATASAALILHKPGLEGAEEKYADNVADRISKAYKQQDARIDYGREIKHSDNRIKSYPGGSHREGNYPRMHLGTDCNGLDFLVIFLKLLLTAHALKP